MAHSSTLIGRDRELQSLRASLARTLDACGQTVLLAGVPGAGKTSIARAFVEEARANGVHICWAKGGDEGARSPWWLWRQVLDSFGGAASAVLSTLDAHARGDDQARRFAVFSGVARFLRERAAEAPVLVVLDDIHAADEPSLALLELFVGQIVDARMLVLATLRTADVRCSQDVARHLAHIGRDGFRIEVSGLRR